MTDMRNLVGVDNHGIQWRGVVLLYTYTESVEEKKYGEEGKEMEKERKREKKVQLAGFELGTVVL